MIILLFNRSPARIFFHWMTDEQETILVWSTSFFFKKNKNTSQLPVLLHNCRLTIFNQNVELEALCSLF